MRLAAWRPCAVTNDYREFILYASSEALFFVLIFWFRYVCMYLHILLSLFLSPVCRCTPTPSISLLCWWSTPPGQGVRLEEWPPPGWRGWYLEKVRVTASAAPVHAHMTKHFIIFQHLLYCLCTCAAKGCVETLSRIFSIRYCSVEFACSIQLPHFGSSSCFVGIRACSLLCEDVEVSTCITVTTCVTVCLNSPLLLSVRWGAPSSSHLCAPVHPQAALQAHLSNHYGRARHRLVCSFPVFPFVRYLILLSHRHSCMHVWL